MDVAVLALAGSATALATGLGAVPVFLLGRRAEALRPFLWGATVGLMTRRLGGGPAAPGAGRGLGGRGGGRASPRAWRSCWPAAGCSSHRDPWIAGHHGAGVRRSLLVFGVLLVHSLPEGFAIGTAFASDTEGLALFVFLAIALQNIPEGTSVAIPMEAAGFGRSQQFWAAVRTSAPQPFGAVIAYLAVEQVTGLLPLSFTFAAGAMLALVVVELLPQALAPGGRLKAVAGRGGAAPRS